MLCGWTAVDDDTSKLFLQAPHCVLVYRYTQRHVPISDGEDSDIGGSSVRSDTLRSKIFWNRLGMCCDTAASGQPVRYLVSF